MPPRRKVITFNKARAIAWLQDGVSKREVGRRHGVSHSVVVRLHQKFQATNRRFWRGPGQDGLRRQHSVKIASSEDKLCSSEAPLQTMIIRGQLRVATNTNVSTKTIRKRLHEVGLRSRRPAVRPRLTAAHRQARLAFCHNHARWTRQQWADVLFSDESPFNLHHHDGRARVWRRRGERYNNGLVQERVAFGGGSIMVWGAFSFRHRTPLYHIVGNLTGQRYRDEIVAPLVLPALHQIGVQAVFLDDNATPHRARLVNNFIQQAGVTRMNWPAAALISTPSSTCGMSWTGNCFSSCKSNGRPFLRPSAGSW
ncbi:hypothetical protein V1264_002829 [Littorina saxatilis]|uniref:Transposase Tc1-like domain-containing protein n=1 Tax=Littorina saxatilis TaxID=31220 RepID=A0AAN9B3I0_9CAEN